MSFYNGIITGKLKETKAFYTENLDFAVKFENEWFLLLERSGRELAFMTPGLEFQAAVFRGEFKGEGVWLTIEVEDVEAAYEKIKNSGVPVVVGLKTEDWGETHFSIFDPNGIGVDFVKYRAPDS